MTAIVGAVGYSVCRFRPAQACVFRSPGSETLNCVIVRGRAGGVMWCLFPAYRPGAEQNLPLIFHTPRLLLSPLPYSYTHYPLLIHQPLHYTATQWSSLELPAREGGRRVGGQAGTQAGGQAGTQVGGQAGTQAGELASVCDVITLLPDQ